MTGPIRISGFGFRVSDFAFAGLTALALATAGCAGYRLGPVLKADYHSVAVPMLRNATHQPQLEAQITNGIIKRLHQDGTLDVVARANADVVVLGRITRYRRTTLRSLREDTGTPREYRIEITARIEFRDRRTGQAVLPVTELTGQADTFIGTDLQGADQQAIPLAADDLARQVVALLVESWE
ncbi:LptE family protein [bacterium]|nr:LptE family protein [bacterium]